ncbi:restriction endonuclease subunit S [Caldisericum sp. AR60]|uniref:restriction endonuclease subunit S n=1 Tax=Caldisericum sp. AR60 TaxID=3397852 RepID=UPI0039FC8EA2
MNENIKLPEGWKVVRLGKVAEISTGLSNVEDAIEDGNYPLFDRSTEIKRSNKYLFDTEAVIIPGEGTEFIPKYYKGKFDLHQRAYAIFDFINLNGKFLYYIMHLASKELIKQSVGTTVISLRLPHFQNLHIPLPPIPEQHKIAEILETVDNAIEKTDAIIEKYNRIKQGLMHDLLTKGIDENWQIRNEKTHKFKDSPLGRIPEEWEVVRLGDIADIKLSNVDKKIDLKEKIIRLCNYLEVYQNDYITKGMNFMYASATNNEIKKFKISKGDVIITKDSEEYNDIAKPAYVRDEIENLVCGYHLALVKPLNNINGLFLTKILSFKNVNIYFQKRANGITRFGLTKGIITGAIIPLPPTPEQERIATVLSQIDEVIEKEKAYKEKLEGIKKGLMEDLLTGKVRVNHLIEEESKDEIG